MVSRIVRPLFGALVLHVFFSLGLAQAQAPAPEAIAAARELVETMHLNDQYNAIVPGIFKNLKPAIVQGRADVERQYDALSPAIIDAFRQRVSEMSDAAAVVYANNFSIEDLHALNDFYKTPTGQRLLQKLPTISQEMMGAGMKFGQSIGGEVQGRMIEELRKKGVTL
jgi:uncharacterized protein